MYRGRILVVEDLPDVRDTLSGLLSDEGYNVRAVSSRAEALEVLDLERFHVAVLDVRLDEADEDNRDGLRLMHEIKEKDPTIAVIILTGYADVNMVREALEPNREGIAPAVGFLEKTEIEKLPEYVSRALEHATSAIKDLITQGENDRVEFKSSIRWDLTRKVVNKNLQKAVAASITGMMNSQGGTLLIGIADDGTVLGIQKDLQTLRRPNIDSFQETLTTIIGNYLGIECMPYIHTRFELIDDRYICVVSVQKSPEPVFFSTRDGHEFWVRMGNSTHNLDVKATTSYIQTNWEKAG